MFVLDIFYRSEYFIQISNENLKDFCKERKRKKRSRVHFRILKDSRNRNLEGGKKRGLFFRYPNNNIKEVLKF